MYASPPPPPPPLRPVLRHVPGGRCWWGEGGLQESSLGVEGCVGRGNPDAWFWRKLNNFKVHLVKRRKTYFNTSSALSRSRSHSRWVRLHCMFVQGSVREWKFVLFFSAYQSLYFRAAKKERKEYLASSALQRHFGGKEQKNKQKGWIEMLLWVSAS